MTIALTFTPDAGRAAVIDVMMRQRLADSLATIENEAMALQPPLELELKDVIVSLRDAKSAPPSIWGHYGELCRAVALDDMAAVVESCRNLNEVVRSPDVGRLSNLRDEQLGPGAASLFARTVNDDPGLPLILVSVEEEVLQRVASDLDSTLELVSEASPQLAGEIEVFARQIVLARGAPGGAVFSGATTIFLWGAVLINPDEVRGRLQLFEALTHECAHALLTGLTGGIDVTENDPSERFKSPLRSDPRPMEGIAHATFVLARIVYGLHLLKGNASLSDKERTQLESMMAANIEHFKAGEEIVTRSAKLTPEGKLIFEKCFEAMRQYS